MGEKSVSPRFLLIVVAILCANRWGPTPAVASEEPPLTPIARITKALEHHAITVQAVVSRVTEPQSGTPYYVTLTQDNATISFIYWPGMQAQLGPKVRPGNLIRARVNVGSYHDQIQLSVRDPSNLQVVSGGNFVSGSNAGTTNAAPVATVAPTRTATPEALPTDTVIGKINTDWAERAVNISGTVSDFRSTGKAWQLKVQDRSGEIAVVLGEKALAGLAITELKPGWVVSVTGPVKVYEGKLAVVPEVAGAVKVTSQ